jgi:SAM-dependent methyltransferase
MTSGFDYEYRGLKASTWDLSRGDTSTWTDRTFYLDVVRQYGQPVLDVGCGTGRIMLDFLAQQGIDIDGVDDSPEMLAICRRKARAMRLEPALHEQKMETLDLPRRYATVLVPSSSLQLLTDPVVAREAVGRFFRHLRPGGVLVTPLGFDWRAGEALDTGWKLRFEKVRPEDGATVRGWERVRHEPERQLWHEEERYEVEADGATVSANHVRSPAGRWYTQAQAVELCRSAGFGEVTLLKAFTHEPASEHDRLICVVAVKQ